MPVFFYRVLLKLSRWMRAAAVRHTWALESSQGFGGVVSLLKQLDGEDALLVLRSNKAKVGGGTRFSSGVVVHNADGNFANLSIGERCHVGRDVFIDLARPLTIGDRVTISMRAILLTHTDPGDSRCGVAPSGGPIHIGDDAYIGAAAILLPGIKIGAGAIVAAGAVVTRDVAPAVTVSGVPARLLPRKPVL